MKEDNKKNNDDFRLDDIDIFFCSNFNELLDDKPFHTDEVLNDKPFSADNLFENDKKTTEILSFDDEPKFIKNDIEILDISSEDEIEILDIDDNKIEILDFDISNEGNNKQVEIPIIKQNNDGIEIPAAKENNQILDSNIESKPTNKRHKKRGIKRIILIIDLIILFILLFFTVYKIIAWSNDNNATNKQIKEIQSNVSISEVDDNSNTIVINNNEPSVDSSKDNDYWNFINKPLISVDFSDLINKNNDTVGWIQVSGTNINYPVVKYFDNEYYLDHSYDKSYNDAGWIFMDYRNNLVDDKNTIIYGHARLNSTMFGTLKNVVKKNWYTNIDNHLVKLSTINSNTSWQVFSTYVINSEDYYIKTSFANDDEYLEFLNNLKSRSVYDYNTSVNENDRILTLSTCYTDNKRVVLHAKLIKIENR